ncbi:hypothetical protein Esti_001314 [Eimeria stiedai]
MRLLLPAHTTLAKKHSCRVAAKQRHQQEQQQQQQQQQQQMHAEAAQEEGAVAGPSTNPLKLEMTLENVALSNTREAQVEGACSSEESSSGMQQQQAVSAVAELQLSPLGATKVAARYDPSVGTSEPQLRIRQMPKAAAAKTQQTLVAFVGGECREEGRVFRLTGISNSDAADTFVPCFLSPYFSLREGGQQQQQQQQQQQEEEVKAEEVLQPSVVSRLDWSEAFRAVSPEEIKHAKDGNALVRELLLKEQQELLQLECALSPDEQQRQLSLSQQLIAAWQRVEVLDKKLEEKEETLRQIEENLAASRLHMKEEWAGQQSTEVSSTSTASAKAVEQQQQQQQEQQQQGLHVYSRTTVPPPAALPSSLKGPLSPASCTKGAVPSHPGPRWGLNVSTVEALLCGKVLCGGSSLKMLQRLRRLVGAADACSLARIPLNLRRRLQQQRQQQQRDQLAAGRPPREALIKAPSESPQTGEANRSLASQPQQRQQQPEAAAAAAPGGWRIVLKRKRRECPRPLKMNVSEDPQEQSLPGNNLSAGAAAAAEGAAAAAAAGEAEPGELCSASVDALEALAASAERAVRTKAFVHSEEAIEQLQRIDRRLEELAGQPATCSASQIASESASQLGSCLTSWTAREAPQEELGEVPKSEQKGERAQWAPELLSSSALEGGPALLQPPEGGTGSNSNRNSSSSSSSKCGLVKGEAQGWEVECVRPLAFGKTRPSSSLNTQIEKRSKKCIARALVRSAAAEALAAETAERKEGDICLSC